MKLAVVTRVGPVPGGRGVLLPQVHVFIPGEILILDDDGREVAGRGRKPGKWDVSIETFDTLEAAAKRAAEVMDL